MKFRNVFSIHLKYSIAFCNTRNLAPWVSGRQFVVKDSFEIFLALKIENIYLQALFFRYMIYSKVDFFELSSFLATCKRFLASFNKPEHFLSRSSQPATHVSLAKMNEKMIEKIWERDFRKAKKGSFSSGVACIQAWRDVGLYS